MSNSSVSDINPEDTSYGYVPDRVGCYIFVIVFGLATLVHLGQTIRFRMWWTIPTILLAGCLEILGWSGRLWSSFNPDAYIPYMIQIVCTIIGPTPLLAANFIIFGAIIRILGPMYSRIGPRKYSLFFVSCDIVSLVIQAAGGAIAAGAGDFEAADLGGNIMLGGIVFQLVIILIYTSLATEFFWRYMKGIPVSPKHSNLKGPHMSKNTKIMISALVLNLLCLFVRAVYRTFELADGWRGEIIKNEVYFNLFDGSVVVIAFIAFNIAHPGVLVGRQMGKDIMNQLDASLNSVEMSNNAFSR